MNLKKSVYLFLFVIISILAYIFIYPNNKNKIVKENLDIQKNQAPEFSLPNQYGDTISLSDFKGKNLLIDFWASWCRTCRVENKNMVKLYKKYSSKGLEFLSISLDGEDKKSKENWLKAINKDDLIWDNLIDNSEIADLYQVIKIPHTVLIDERGMIVAKRLLGEALENEIKKIINE